MSRRILMEIRVNQKKRHLGSEGMRELIDLTNSQFSFWGDAVRKEISGTDTDSLESGQLMDMWFICSNLSIQPDFKINKKSSYDFIPGLSINTTRKYAGIAQKLGLVETVSTKGNTYLRLSSAGTQAVEKTLNRWIESFQDIDKKYFSKTILNDSEK